MNSSMLGIFFSITAIIGISILIGMYIVEENWTLVTLFSAVNCVNVFSLNRNYYNYLLGENR